MINKIITISILLLVGFSPLVAQEPLVVDLDKAMSMAKSNNIDLKRATLELSGKRKDRNNAFNAFIPKLEGKASIAKFNEDPALVQGYQPHDTNFQYGFTTSFQFSPALFSGVSTLKREYELGQITYTEAVMKMESSVKEVFYNIIVLREQTSLLEDNLSTIQSRYDLTKLNYEAGLVSELELLKVQVSLENFKPELSNVKNAYSATLMNFKSMLGVDLERELIIEGEINPEVIELTIDEAYNMALKNNNQLRSVHKSIELMKSQKSTLFSYSFIPVVDLRYNHERALNDPFKSGNFKEKNFADDSGMFAVSLVYNFDALLPGSKQRKDIDKIKRSLEDINYQKSALLDGMKVQVTNHINSLNNSLTIQKGLELNVDLAYKTLGKVEQAYKAGTAQLLEVENAENEYKKARLELLREKYNYTLTSLKLNTIISAK